MNARRGRSSNALISCRYAASSSGSSSSPDSPSTPLNSDASASPSRSASLVRPSSPASSSFSMSGRSRKALEPEVRQERRRRDIGVGRAGRRAARPGGDEAFAAQRGDRVARNLPAQKLRQLPPGDRLKIPDRHQDKRVRARQFGFLRAAERGPDGVAEPQFRPETPSAGDRDDLVGRPRNSSRISSMMSSRLQALPTTRARFSRNTGSAEAKIAASTRPIHSRQRAGAGRSSSSRSRSPKILRRRAIVQSP